MSRTDLYKNKQNKNMIYIKAFINEFVSTFRWLVDPHSKIELIMGLIIMLLFVGISIYASQFLFLAVFLLQTIYIFYTFIANKLNISKKISFIVYLFITIPQIILLISQLIFY